MIYAFSDIHVSPEGERRGLFAFLEEAEAQADLIVGAGDTLDLARFHFREILEGPLGRAAVGRMREVARKKPLVLLDGNHDPWLSRYKKELGPITLAGARYEVPGRPHTLFFHGHRELDWSLAPLWPIYGWAFSFFPDLAFLYDRVFPTPGLLKTRKAKRTGLHEPPIIPRFYQAALFMHYRAMLLAIKTGKRIVFGHTHLPEVRELDGFQVGNCGDDLDSHTGLVLEDGRMRLWRLKAGD